MFLKTDKNKNATICLRECFEKEEIKFCFCSVAGVDKALCDYSNNKIQFDVSKDIKTCEYWGTFEYNDQGKVVCKNFVDGKEIAANSIDCLVDFMNMVAPGTGGYYEQCEAYISNGKVDAIKIFDK